LSLGGWLSYGGTVAYEDTLKLMKQAWDAGVNYFDTAEVYAAGQSEILMGRALKEMGLNRKDFVLSTKIFWGGKGPNDLGLSRKHLIEGAENSLKRLQLEYADVIFAHRPDPNTPIEETVRAFNYLIDHGKTFYWGTSEWSAQEIAEAHRIAEKLNLVGPIVEQPQYSLLYRERFESHLSPALEKYGMGATIWSPLASGVLTGKYNNGIPEDSRFGKATEAYVTDMRDELLSDQGKIKIEKVKKMTVIADRLGVKPSQLALAWCLKQPYVSTVIMGATKTSQLSDNLASLQVFQKLDAATLKELNQIFQ